MNQPSYWFSLTNTGPACSLNGYPGIELVDAAGRPIRIDTARGGGFIAEDPGPRDITLNSHGKAWFVISTVTICGSGAAPASSAVLVTPPGEHGRIHIDAGIEYCEPSIGVSAVSSDEGALHHH